MNPLYSILSSSRGSLSSTRATLIASAAVILALIAASVITALIRDHVTQGIVELLRVATGFFLMVATLKWSQGFQEKAPEKASEVSLQEKTKQNEI